MLQKRNIFKIVCDIIILCLIILGIVSWTEFGDNFEAKDAIYATALFTAGLTIAIIMSLYSFVSMNSVIKKL